MKKDSGWQRFISYSYIWYGSKKMTQIDVDVLKPSVNPKLSPNIHYIVQYEYNIYV